MWNEFRERSSYCSKSRSSAACQDVLECYSLLTWWWVCLCRSALGSPWVSPLYRDLKWLKNPQDSWRDWMTCTQQITIISPPSSSVHTQNFTSSMWFYSLSHRTDKFNLILQWHPGFIYSQVHAIRSKSHSFPWTLKVFHSRTSTLLHTWSKWIHGVFLLDELQNISGWNTACFCSGVHESFITPWRLYSDSCVEL